MSCSNISIAPNPRLQRTRLRSPLSRKTLGRNGFGDHIRPSALQLDAYGR
jgi:hypothetical protein